MPRLLRRRPLQWTGAALALVLAWPVWSVSQSLAAPGTDTIAARVAEWARGHGMDWAVTDLERIQYDLTQPATGGTVAGGIPTATENSAPSPTRRPTRRTDRLPAALTPIAAQPLPHEGAWRPLLRVGGRVAAEVAYLRADTTHTSFLTAVIWMDPHLVSFALHPGFQEPGRIPGVSDQIPSAQVGSVLATFNAGFRMTDAQGGYWQRGHTAKRLVRGAASMVLTRGGGLRVEAWPDGSPTGHIDAVRQNLHLLIDGGVTTPLVANPSTTVWGRTVGNKAYVWRSGVGTRADGSVVFTVGPAMSVQSLAAVLADAGATEAMELDINKDWTNYLTYTHHTRATAVPHKILASQVPNPSRYLQPSSRDFVAVLPR